MKSDARVVVIGGGVVGCSVIYHLTKLGWKDVVLLEKEELTSGSTWHAAANGNTFNANPATAEMMRRTFDLWPILEKETGQSLSSHPVGGLMLAETPDRLDEIRRISGIGRTLGYEYELLGPNEVRQFHPLVDPTDLLGAIYDPMGGHVDPYGITMAYAKGAQAKGAEINRRTPVSGLRPLAGGDWMVETPAGEIRAGVIVNAAGFYANEIAAMTGARLPMHAMEHQYLVTEAIPEVAALDAESPVVRDVDRSYYARHEGEGYLVGIYEQDSRTFGENGMPADFAMELLPPDLDRIGSYYEAASERLPFLRDAGLKRIVNGPFCFTPDVRPLLGWMPGQRNHFCAAGFLAGISMGGGYGEQIAEWIVEGRPSIDLSDCDVARFGAWANDEFALERAHHAYSTRYKIHYPSEEIPDGRPVRKPPLYDRYVEQGAVFGNTYGWERPLWFAPEGSEARDIYSFRRGNWFDAVGMECRALRGAVGLINIQPYANYDVTGPGAANLLDRLLANRLPAADDRIRLAPLLDEKGGYIGDLTVLRLAADRYRLTGAGAMQGIHMRWFRHHGRDADATIVNRSDEIAGFSIAGPKAGQLVERLLGRDIAAVPFLSGLETKVSGIDILLMRIGFTGELGYELHAPLEAQIDLYDAIHAAGAAFGLRDVGARAAETLRLEKLYPRFGTELTSEVTPHETGQGCFVDLEKGDFVGRDALRARPEGARIRANIKQNSPSLGEDELDEMVAERFDRIDQLDIVGGERQVPGGRWRYSIDRKTLHGDYVSLRMDITERKQTEIALLAAKHEADMANEAKSQFLAAMSHELRTPLNAILGFSDILRNEFFGSLGEPKYQDYANDIHNSGEHLLSLVNDLLDISTIEAGKVSLTKERLTVEEIFADSYQFIAEEAAGKGIELVKHTADDLPTILVDRRAIRQIFLNLLSNALKHTPEGGKVSMSAKRSETETIFEIADTGSGIPPELIPHLGDPFMRGESDREKAAESWGLGLTITKSLVELHDGHLLIESVVDKGTTVTVTLPDPAA